MPTAKTEVLYLTSKARQELQKLDNAVKKSGKTAKSSFGDGGRSVRRFGAQLRSVNPQLGTFVRNLGKTGLSSSVIAGGFVAAGAAIAVTVANVVDLAGQLADIDARIDVINKTAERTLKFQDLASAVGDADENRRLDVSRRELKVQQASLAFRQNELERARDLSNELVRIRSEEFRKIDAAHKRSIRSREDAEKRLADKLAEGDIVGGEFRNQPKGRQIGSLTVKAEQEARKGNIDAAEALIDRAKELSEELGNHVFFTNQIDRANGAVVRKLRENVKEAKNTEGALDKQRSIAKGRIDDANELKKALDAQLRSVLRQNRALSNQRKLIGESAKAARDVQLAEEGQRRVATGVRQVRETAGAIGGQALLGQARDLFANAVKALKSPGTLATGTDTSRAIDLALTKLSKNLEKAFEDGVISPREAQQLGEFTAKLSDAAGIFEAGLAEGTITPGKEQDVQRFVSLFQGLENIIRGAAQARSGGIGFDEGITPGAQRQRQEFERTVTRREVQQEINVKVEGGMIDQKTIEQITDIIRREVRKEVSKGAGSD